MLITNQSVYLHVAIGWPDRQRRSFLLFLLILMILMTGISVCHAEKKINPEKIKVVGLSQDVAMLEIAGQLKVLEVGEHYQNITLIAADSNTATLEIDGEHQTYTLSEQLPLKTEPKPKPTPVKIWPDQNGMYVVGGEINGFPVDFLIDTGATTIALNKHLANRFDIDYQQGEVGLVATAGGWVKAYPVTLARVKVRHILLEDVAALVIDGHFPQEILLGMSFLKRVDLQRQGKLLELRLPETAR